MKNIELKVKVNSLKATRDLVVVNGAREEGVLYQVDTYFNTKHGRLKFREINDEIFQIIYYNRPDTSESKLSTYKIIPFTKDFSRDMLLSLKESNGVKIVVEKKRELWIYKNTRIHLDTVKKLGEFVELETVVNNISLSDAKMEHKNVINMLSLGQYEKCIGSYSDLLSE